MTIASLSKNISKSLKFKKLKFSKLSENKNMLVISLSAFFLLTTVATYLGTQKTEFTYKIKNKGQAIVLDAVIYPPLPVLTTQSDSSFPVISAQAALAIDLDSKVTLYEKDPDGLYLPASTTKIVSAMVALDHYQDEDIVKVGQVFVEGQKMGLSFGEEITAGSLIDGLLILSANDAAEVLSQNYPGGRDVFIAQMNKIASDLNLYNTHFENPSGLDGGRHFSTARDLVKIATIAMQDERFSRRVGVKQKLVSSIDGRVIHNLVSTNELLGKVEGVLGVKTGWTENARENLVTYLERDGKKIMIALMGSQDRFGETKELIDWIYSNYDWQEVKYPN